MTTMALVEDNFAHKLVSGVGPYTMDGIQRYWFCCPLILILSQRLVGTYAPRNHSLIVGDGGQLEITNPS